MALISSTKYNQQVIADWASGATPVFTRAGVKPNFISGLDATTDTPVYELVTAGSTRTKEVVADAVGDDQHTRALAVDNDGIVWGTGGGGLGSGTTYRESLKIFKLDPSGTGAWELVHTFAAGKFVYSLHISSGGSIFVGTYGGEVWRFRESDASDIAVVLTMTSTGGVMGSWSFADKGDGATVWIAEFGSKDGTVNAGHLIYRSDEDGAADSFTTIFDLYEANGVTPPIAKGWHLHKLHYHAPTDILFVAHGDGEQNDGTPDETVDRFIWKSAGGSAGNWQKIPYKLTVGTKIKYLNPTGAITVNSTQILWGEDVVAYGAWLHTIDTEGTADTFEHVILYPGSSATFWSLGRVNDILFAGTRNPSAAASGLESALYIAHIGSLNNYVLLDYASEDMSWEEIAGLGNDNKVYISYSTDKCDSFTTVRYSLPKLGATYGLGIDPVSTNKALDPWFENSASHGSSTYAAGFWVSGGKYNPSGGTGHYMTKNFAVNQAAGYTTVTATEPLAISFWAKWDGVTYPSAVTEVSLRLFMLQYNGASLVKTSSAKVPISTLAYTPMDWKRYTVIIDPSDAADAWDGSTNRLLISVSPSDVASGYFLIDGISVVQGGATGAGAGQQYNKVRPQLARVAATSAKDVVVTTLTTALPTAWAAVGKIVPRYHFDVLGTYCLWSAYNTAGDDWIALVIHNGQIKLIDDANDVSSPLLTTTTGLPTQVLSVYNTHPAQTWGAPDLPSDTLMWALEYVDGAMRMSFATQRSEIETITGAVDCPTTLVKLYDGCSALAGQEIAGVVVYRAIFDFDYETAWEQNQIWPYFLKKSLDINIGISV